MEKTLTQAVLAAIKDLYGQEVDPKTVQVQKTRRK